MNESESAEKTRIVRSLRTARDTISEINELVELIAGEWWNLGLTCKCDAKKGDGCSVCEISDMLKSWQEERDAEGPQE